MTADTIALRNCTELEEFRACVALQKEVWGFADNELVPLRIFSLAPKIGGQVIGAWDGETLVGFAFSIPGTRNGHPYLHSHMLAVKEGYRNTGLGRRIKLFQREDAIAHGYELLEWTFDPLEIKNAYLNLERLGAIARRYNINQYGITSSPLQGFLPTDRLVAEWWLKSKRVETLLSTGKHPSFARESVSKCPPISMPGRRSRKRGRKPPIYSCAIASSFWRRSRAGWRAWAMSATRRATARSCWAAGMRTGRTRASDP